MTLVKNKWRRQTLPKTSQGFSLIELLVALAVALVLAAIAIPSVTTTYSQYRLGVQATLIANQLDLLRMTAVRKNTTITLYSNILTSGCATPNSNVVLYIDVDKGGACDSKDPQLMLPADMQISNGLSTAPTGMPAVTSMGTIYSPAVKLPAAGIAFASNGTISGGAGPYIIVIGYTATSKYGFRAITVTPMGQIKVWTASASGSWSVTS
jgi:prepilin-type N-terminal cleavage/methylation domain-containing protein